VIARHAIHHIVYRCSPRHCHAFRTLCRMVHGLLRRGVAISAGPSLEVFSTMESTMEALFNWMAIGDQGDTGDVFDLAGILLYPGIGVIDNMHSTVVESSPPPLRV